MCSVWRAGWRQSGPEVSWPEWAPSLSEPLTSQTPVSSQPEQISEGRTQTLINLLRRTHPESYHNGCSDAVFHLVLLQPVGQVLCGAAVVEWGSESVKDFFFGPFQSFVDPVQFTGQICSSGIVLNGGYGGWGGSKTVINKL